MAKNTVVSSAIAIEQLRVITNGLESGSGKARIRIYDAAQPADPSVAPGGALVFDIDPQDPAFSTPVASSPGAESTLNGTPLFANALVTTSNGVGFVRYMNSDLLAYFDGSVGVTAGQFDLIISKLQFISGEQLQINSPYVLHQNQSQAG